jgi:hypothetical protein
MLADHRDLASIRLTPIDPRLVAAQQLSQHVRVMHIRCSRRHRVDQLGFAVHVDMELDVEYHFWPLRSGTPPAHAPPSCFRSNSVLP